jgi:SnoaL-like domain
MNAVEARTVIAQHWKAANERDWSAFERLLDPALRYEVPQTREYIDSGEGYLDMFRAWPGEWSATIKELVCEKSAAICIIDFHVGSETMTGISHFKLSDQRIVAVTDYWPEAYEPPKRETKHLKRLPVEA